MKLIAKMKIKDKMLMRNIQSRLKRGLELVVESNKGKMAYVLDFSISKSLTILVIVLLLCTMERRITCFT